MKNEIYENIIRNYLMKIFKYSSKVTYDITFVFKQFWNQCKWKIRFCRLSDSFIIAFLRPYFILSCGQCPIQQHQNNNNPYANKPTLETKTYCWWRIKVPMNTLFPVSYIKQVHCPSKYFLVDDEGYFTAAKECW